MDKGLEAGYAAEIKAFGELAMTPHSKALMGLFHGQVRHLESYVMESCKMSLNSIESNFCSSHILRFYFVC